MNNDLISREDLKKALTNAHINMALTFDISSFNYVMNTIDNAPAIKTYCYFCGQTEHGQIEKRPQGEYVDISKLRLMTVEECAGHTIEYAMGWKACIEWLKKGGAE